MGTGPHRGPCPVTAGSGAGMLPLGVQLARHYLESGAESYPAAAMVKHHRASGPPLTAHPGLRRSLEELSLTWRDPAGGREFGRFKPSGPWAADR